MPLQTINRQLPFATIYPYPAPQTAMGKFSEMANNTGKLFGNEPRLI
jgi:hypothetical protein